jgi:GntR family transcriptional regulator
VPGKSPKYLAIAEQLRAAVAAGTYPPGTRLPGEKEISRDYDVAAETARKIQRQLVSWGIAEARKGSGLYVRDFKPVVRDSIRRLGGDTWPTGQSIWSADVEGRALSVDQVAVTETSEVPAEVRTVLGLAQGEAAVIRSRRYSLDGKPVMVARSWLPASIASGTPIAERDTGPGGIYARLAELGHAPARFREDLRATAPRPDIVENLQVAPGTPVVEIARTAYDASGNAVELNEMTADSSAYIFRYEFEA